MVTSDMYTLVRVSSAWQWQTTLTSIVVAVLCRDIALADRAVCRMVVRMRSVYSSTNV